MCARATTTDRHDPKIAGSRWWRLRRVLHHDWPAILLLILTLGSIVGYLEIGPGAGSRGGYRVIDFARVRRLMDSGQLSTQEARWYHRTEAAEEENHSVAQRSK
ncbi:MAG: hypothetical protein D6720_00925 [Gammaproteobacteria bacterium]|nr:MAG: hypothetical protein D6720_00925 [Gammaproteobacteria bacterium]